MFSKRTSFFMLALMCFASATAHADGILLPVEKPQTTLVIPDRLFAVKYHYVNVTIDNQLCITKVDQVFHNDTDVDLEGMYIFPMPEGSAITKFSMYAGEQEIKGKILTKAEARSIYESIVRRRKDPALLEYVDRNTFRASVYPIPANGDKRITLDYVETATKSGSTYRYVYPLSTERFSAKPLNDCRIKIRIHTKQKLTNIYSPTHTIRIDRIDDHTASVTWEAENVKPDTDLILYYSISDDDLGIDLVAHREEGEKGYFMLLASPNVGPDKSQVLPKNVVFVFDRSGSMAGEKIEQAKDALKFCVNSLNEQDQFNLITFSDTADVLFAELEKPTQERVKQAIAAVDDLSASGGTNINEALLQALRQFAQYGEARNYIIFLTDGLPTVGITDLEKILTNAREANRSKVRIFAFGVGYDVNAHLLDKLSQESRGDADYVRPKENIEVKVSSFFAKVTDPLLADVKLNVSGVRVSECYPSSDLPDIFRGSQLIVFGRYDGAGKVRVELSGTVRGSTRTFVLETSLPSVEASNEFIPQLWAARKIGYLLDEIRLHKSQELIDEVVRLSKEYGIPTEYTSFLADERMPVEAELKRVRLALGKAAEVQSGTYGISQSANARDLKNQSQLPQAAAAQRYYYAYGDYAGAPAVSGQMAANQRLGGVWYDASDRLVVAANVQNVARKTFYQRGNFWEDSALQPNQKLVQIKQFSDAHFALLRAYSKLAQYSTLGNVRLVLENGQAVEIGPEGKEVINEADLKGLLRGLTR
ncbi:MAG: VIT and VWA domain-containing protein [Armatimonadota bacterium]|nr:VIT and VWA domain-containing protein [Armatimonadota bacterium]